MRELQVLHWRGGQGADADAPSVHAIPDLFLIGTCQRRVGLFADPEATERARAAFPADGALEHFRGRAAYTFLLRFACGLESRLTGETEIFGQIKEAWRLFGLKGNALARDLTPLMQQLFQDTKDLRAQFLSGLGSASYGSLVRRLRGESTAEGATLLIGAGQLAQSVAPWLSGPELWLLNRDAARAASLGDLVRSRRPEQGVRLLDQHAELAAWESAAQVVLCVPLDPVRDAQRVSAWQRRAKAGQVIHLGTRSVENTAWAQIPDLIHLGAVFELMRGHNEQRRRQIDRARRGCAEKALLRSLGNSVTQAHGWEDLLAFGTL